MALVVSSIALILALSVTLLAVSARNTTGSIEVNATPITFDLPVANATITKDYSDSELQYNETLKQWEVHKAIDFTAKDNSPVLAVYAGTVIEAGNNYLGGYYVIIQHEAGLKTIYRSLAKELKVKKGDVVQKGTILGTISSSAAGEAGQNAHLHFEVTLNDKPVNPNNYFNFNK